MPFPRAGFLNTLDSMYLQLQGSGLLDIRPLSEPEIREYMHYYFNGYQSDFLNFGELAFMLDAHSSDIVIAGTDIAFRSVNIRQEIALITVEIVVHIFPDLRLGKEEDGAYSHFLNTLDSMYLQLQGSGLLDIRPLSEPEIRETDIAFRSVNIRQEIALITVEIVVHIFPDLRLGQRPNIQQSRARPIRAVG